MKVFLVGMRKDQRKRLVYVEVDDSYRHFLRITYRNRRRHTSKMIARFEIFKLLEAGTTGSYNIRNKQHESV